MKRYLLDTNVLLHLNNSYMGWESIARKIAEAESGTILLSAATVFEIARMEERGKFKKKVVRACVEMLSIFPIEPITPEIASISGTIHGWFMNTTATQFVAKYNLICKKRIKQLNNFQRNQRGRT